MPKYCTPKLLCAKTAQPVHTPNELCLLCSVRPATRWRPSAWRGYAAYVHFVLQTNSAIRVLCEPKLQSFPKPSFLSVPSWNFSSHLLLVRRGSELVQVHLEQRSYGQKPGTLFPLCNVLQTTQHAVPEIFKILIKILLGRTTV